MTFIANLMPMIEALFKKLLEHVLKKDMKMEAKFHLNF